MPSQNLQSGLLKNQTNFPSNHFFCAINTTNSNVTALQNTVAGKQDKLTIDSTPTSGSSNPVSSGGVYTAINSKVDDPGFNFGICTKKSKTYYDAGSQEVTASSGAAQQMKFYNSYKSDFVTDLIYDDSSKKCMITRYPTFSYTTSSSTMGTRIYLSAILTKDDTISMIKSFFTFRGKGSFSISFYLMSYYSSRNYLMGSDTITGTFDDDDITVDDGLSIYGSGYTAISTGTVYKHIYPSGCTLSF